MTMRSIACVSLVLVAVCALWTQACLITNCPRGGKRDGKFAAIQQDSVKPCVSCGPGGSGQCFGPGICCGPFGCLLGTAESLRCRRDGYFHESEPCIAGSGPCRKNVGRCAGDGICCSQESCHMDTTCDLAPRQRLLTSSDLLGMVMGPGEYDQRKK